MQAPPPLRHPGSRAHRDSPSTRSARKRCNDVSKTAWSPPRTKSPRDAAYTTKARWWGNRYSASPSRSMPAKAARRRMVRCAYEWTSVRRSPPSGWYCSWVGERDVHALEQGEAGRAAVGDRRAERVLLRRGAGTRAVGRAGRAAPRCATASHTRGCDHARGTGRAGRRRASRSPRVYAEGERGDREVGEEVDAVEVRGAHRIAVRTLVERPQRWRRAGDHVADARPPAANGRRETQRFLVRLLADTVGERDARVTVPGARPHLVRPRPARSAARVSSESPAWRNVSISPARVCLPLVGSSAVMPSSDPLQGAGPATGGAEPRSVGRIRGVHQDRESRREDDRRAVHGQRHPTSAAVARLVGEAAWRQGRAALRAEEPQLPRGRRARQADRDRVVGPAPRELRLVAMHRRCGTRRTASVRASLPPHGHRSSRLRVMVPHVLHRHCCGNELDEHPAVHVETARPRPWCERAAPRSRPSSIPVAVHGAIDPSSGSHRVLVEGYRDRVEPVRNPPDASVEVRRLPGQHPEEDLRGAAFDPHEPASPREHGRLLLDVTQ